MGIEVALIASAVLAAGSTAYTAREQRKAATKVRKSGQARDARQEARISAQEADEQKIRMRDIQRTGRRRRAGATPRQRSTILTGPLGISSSAPGTAGGKTLLGM